ncbi:MAG TPA: hypothetical protein GXZ58_03480 [Bacilli bacterium]|nr:hypothetical protein [Bacilli bacterium]
MTFKKRIFIFILLTSFTSLILIITNQSLFGSGEVATQTSPTENLKLNTTTFGNGQRLQRVYAIFEWTEKRIAERELITFSIDGGIDIIPNSYQATILTKQSPEASWVYYGDAGGRPFQIENERITWQWSGESAYYKGYVSFLVDTESFDSAKLNVDYHLGEQHSDKASITHVTRAGKIFFTNQWD